MSRTLRPFVVLALVALIASIAAGCGSSGGGADTGGGGGATGAQSAADQAKGVKFAECIRGHGVPHFPDPDPKGDYAFGVDVSPAVWRQAVDACKALEPPGALSGKRSPKEQSTALQFARCMRAKGVDDFPDPANGAPLIDTTHIPSSNRPGGMTILNATIARCKPLLKLAAGGQR
jgi:hypothetical protein